MLLLQRKDKWNREKLDKLQSEIDDLTERVNEAESFNIKGNKYDNRRFKQMVKRTQQQLIEFNRLKKGEKSTGRPAVVDEEIENFLVKCIAQINVFPMKGGKIGF